MISKKKLDFFITNNLNVLFSGKKGVGKSSIIIDAFERHDLKWKYFSASTMDPWVDFIGVPKEKKEKDGTSYLDLVRPKEFQDDEVEALFFDEFNRSHKKIRNAVMELIQFKSINGRKFSNLRFIWAAINPEDDASEEYDVEKLDPAQKDRFHVFIDIPYRPDPAYFKSKYGVQISGAALSWWSELPAEIKDMVSPRRLDYAIEIYKNNGDMEDVLPKKSNISKLKKALNYGPAKKRLKAAFDSGDKEKGREFIQDINNFSDCIDLIMKNDGYLNFFLPLMSKEDIATLLSKSSSAIIQKGIISKIKHDSELIKAAGEIVLSGTNNRLKREVRKAMVWEGVFSSIEVDKNLVKKDFCFEKATDGSGVVMTYRKDATNSLFDSNIKTIESHRAHNTHERFKQYRKLESIIGKNLDRNRAFRALDALWSIVSRTQIMTLETIGNQKGYKNRYNSTITPVVTLFNHLIRVINEDAGGSFYQMSKNHPSILNIDAKLSRMKNNPNIYRPSSDFKSGSIPSYKIKKKGKVKKIGKTVNLDDDIAVSNELIADIMKLSIGKS